MRRKLLLFLLAAVVLIGNTGCGLPFGVSSPAVLRADLQGTWEGRMTDNWGDTIIVEWGFDFNEYHALSYYRDRDGGMLETGTFTIDGTKLALTGNLAPLKSEGQAEAISYTVECNIVGGSLSIESGSASVKMRKTSHSAQCPVCADANDDEPTETPPAAQESDSSSTADPGTDPDSGANHTTGMDPDTDMTPDPGSLPEPDDEPDTDPEPDPEPEPEPDPEAEAEAQRLAFSEQWKRAVYNRVREFHEELLNSVPEKHESFGDWYDHLRFAYSVSLYDAMFDAPNLILSDKMHEIMVSRSTLYSINGGMLDEIVTAQWITPMANILTGERDMVEVTWTGGGTWSESRYFRFVDGYWRQQSFVYETGGGQFFTDEATGEYSEDWDETERLLNERLKDHEYLPLEALHFIEFEYATIDGQPIPWSHAAVELSAFLDNYDGIHTNVT